ncbi:MAG TPA: TonB-dependent receptor [Gemmatimonadaceae bacterium]|nr:TonB-dependent receptor [Gemmatimonadaceae bacterium]
MGNRLVFALALLVPGVLAGQSGSVIGRVTDTRNGDPIGGAAVRVEGTALIVETGSDGRYRITRVPEGQHTITARGIGYKMGGQTVTVAAGSEVTADFALVYSPANLQQIVVTGTAGDQTRAAQGAVIASIPTDSLTAKAPVQSLTEVLSGRVSSVNVQEASGTTGTAPRITIRGPASISLSDAPIVFIDGVRVESGQRQDIGVQSQTLEALGGQGVTALNDISPEDIESIEVVKGPAAATLYGADASAGVIQIITKKGKLGSHPFRQTFLGEWDQVQPNFTPYTIYGTCPGPLGSAPLCTGKASGSVVSYNPLKQNNIYRDGNLGELAWSGQGGTENFGYFLSGTANNEQGTTPNNYLRRRTARGNMHWVIIPSLSVDATATVSLNDNRVPMGDDSNYGYLADGEFETTWFLATPGNNGLPQGGITYPLAGLEAINDDIRSLRTTPTLQVQFVPLPWFNNRLTLGADFTSTHATTFFPPNDQGWYNGDQTNGYIEDAQEPINVYTVDYLGNIHTNFANGSITSNTSFGSQYIDRVDNYLAGVGIGLATSSSNLVSSAAATSSVQSFTETKQLGFLAQEELGFRQMLFVQGGFRVDQNSSFGKSYGAFFLPKVSGSLVLSQAPFWQSLASTVSTFRLRAAYGETGRSPLPGASLTTYAPVPYVTPSGGTAPGFDLASPGNPNLKPERGTEFEAGVDGGFFKDRFGFELTYFNKHTNNLLLQNPIAPSLAYTVQPYVNAGAVDNSGLEFTVRATPISSRNFDWDASFTGNTLRNNLESLGGLTISQQPLLTSDITQRYNTGFPLESYFSSKITGTTANAAIVTNAPVYDGPQFPTFQGSVNTTLTLFKTIRLYGNLTTQRGGKTLNVTQWIMDLVNYSGQTNLPVSRGGYSHADSLRRFGPWKTASGQTVGGVTDAYVQRTDFTRLQELSATLLLPPSIARMLHGASASLTIGGRNLWLGKASDFQGWDPEVTGRAAPLGNAINPLNQQLNFDEFTVPQPRRLFARLNLTF